MRAVRCLITKSDKSTKGIHQSTKRLCGAMGCFSSSKGIIRQLRAIIADDYSDAWSVGLFEVDSVTKLFILVHLMHAIFCCCALFL